MVHNIHSVRVDARKANELPNTLDEHGDDRQHHAPLLFLEAPAVHEHAYRRHDAHEPQDAAEPVLGDGLIAFRLVFLDIVI